MSVTRRRQALAFVCLAGTLALPVPARACTCAPPPTVQQSVERADLVFLGLVERFELVGTRRVATFRVKTVWKGSPGPRVRVTTGYGDGDCGFHFIAGIQYLVYASRQDSSASETNTCSRTTWLVHGGGREDLRVLGPGTPSR